ncbi:MAG: SWIM zinc finger family protein [Caldilineaceae bacterium]
MPTLPKLTERDVQSWFDSGSFSRGRSYYKNGYIQHPTVQGAALKGQCYGSAPVPYRVQVTLGDAGIVAADCSCPLGGNCKHCVALLLTWVHEPAEFAQVEEVANTLASWDKAALIALIAKMVERHPDLDSLIALQQMSAGGPAKPITAEVIMRQIDNAMPDYDPYDDYGYGGYGAESALYEILNTGDQHAAANDWANAVTIYSTVAQRLCANYESYYDEEGEIVGLIDTAGEGLGNCLANVTDATLRQRILQSMFDIWQWDSNMGGYGAADSIPGPLLEHSSVAEKALVAEWVRDNIPTPGQSRSDWNRQRFGGLLLMLEADTLDDDAFIETCRQTGRHAELLDRLLSLQRVDEAVAYVRNISDYELVANADRFVQYGHAQVAWDLVAEQATKSQDSRLNQWLKKQAKESGDAQTALGIAQAIFWNRPSATDYTEIKALAEELGNWPIVHAQTVKKLAEQANYQTLTEIYLVDGDVENALKSLEQMKQDRTRRFPAYFSPVSLRAKVAAAATASHPAAAIGIYLELAEESIAGKNRNSYADAANVLLKVRQIYQKQGQAKEWLAQIAQMRHQHRNLRAMQDEFDKAGLEGITGK